jgi:hypothetical protein
LTGGLLFLVLSCPSLGVKHEGGISEHKNSFAHTYATFFTYPLNLLGFALEKRIDGNA